jgi:putative transcriptional regulator
MGYAWEITHPQDLTIPRAGVSQAVFASYLNVTVSLVSQWERGEKHPRGSSLKLLTLVRKKGLDAIA